VMVTKLSKIQSNSRRKRTQDGSRFYTVWISAENVRKIESRKCSIRELFNFAIASMGKMK